MLKEKQDMHPMNDKMKMRKKAMDMMMKEGPGFAMKVAKKSMGHSMDEGNEEMGMDEQMQHMAMGHGEEEGEMMGNKAHAQESMESVMVSPDEKKMILQMRQKKKMMG
jgi:hypothetical protein